MATVRRLYGTLGAFVLVALDWASRLQFVADLVGVELKPMLDALNSIPHWAILLTAAALIGWDVYRNRRPAPKGETLHMADKPKPEGEPPSIGRDAVVSIYQSGGQTAATINNYVPPDRSISSDVGQRLVSGLMASRAADLTIMFVAASGHEGEKYAQEFRAILERAGWRVASVTKWMDGSVKGVVVFVPLGVIPPAADALLDALSAVGISASGIRYAAVLEGTVWLVIGEK